MSDWEGAALVLVDVEAEVEEAAVRAERPDCADLSPGIAMLVNQPVSPTASFMPEPQGQR